ncbi:hypothetical protein ACVIQS_002475 [Bradyrhizobium diazoefficiens]|uniref:Uncharacterized protein n=1 Tax=Bradyrhizobium diazoefficiens TaxID=1355477 RepID=A0A0E4FUT5_9BRAD|nr:hypothetical protein NK6_4984 [Bradyrhizobium diazoefficiens]
MGKGFLIAATILATAIAIDQIYNFGIYTDHALAMLRHIRHSLG